MAVGGKGDKQEEKRCRGGHHQDDQDHRGPPEKAEFGESVSRLAKPFPRQRAGRPDLIGAKGLGQAANVGRDLNLLQHEWGTCFACTGSGVTPDGGCQHNTSTVRGDGHEVLRPSNRYCL